ncbi:MAG TPA: pyridine nucleotide-disulfide oxidoreductase, partial [Caldimonas sp.]
MPRKKLLVIGVLVAAVFAFFVLDLGRFLSLDAIRAHQASLAALYAQRPLVVIGAYFAIYVAVTALSLPGAAVLTLAGGAVLGLVAGTIVTSFASSLGATLAFLASRYMLRDAVRSKFANRLAAVDAGLAK